MQAKKAAQLRREHGDRKCDHPQLDREYMLGMDTGDKVCTSCGEVFTPKEAEDIRAKRKL